MPNLARKSDRRALAQRREPYWQKLGPGAFLGFRRGPDTWIARFRDRSGKQNYSALDVPRDSDEFTSAKKLAEAWFAQLGSAVTSSAKRGAVLDAIKAYLDDLKRHGRGEAATIAAARFRVIVPDSDPLATMKLEDTTREDFENWRARLLPGRKPESVNRYAGALAAALNAAVDELGFVGDARAWTLKALTDDREHDEATAVFLSPAQRKALLASAEPHAADFFQALALTGARPGELARAVVADFEDGQLRLTHRKGRPPKLRVRYTVLSAEGVALFARMCRNKLPRALIFTDADHDPWTRQNWGYAMRKTIASYHEDCRREDRLPGGVSAYAFRHSRISELLQVHGVDPLTVAQQTGTSLHQIEKTYFKFIPSAMKQKLAAVRESA